MRDGQDAELIWLTADGDETKDIDRIYADLFDHVEAGLRGQLFPAELVATYIAPLRRRVDERLTPAGWRLALAESQLDTGAELNPGIERAQRRYLAHQEGTLLAGSFVDWLSPSTAA